MRRFGGLLLAVLLIAAWALSGHAQLAPISYDAISDRGTRAEPALPSIGGAGAAFFDPVFSSQLWRITDGSTRPGLANRSYRTPSSAHQNAWSADGAYFYVVSTDGTVVPYAFDAAAERARRIEPAPGDEGGLVLRFYIEPHFSYTTPGVIYGSFSGSGATLRTLDTYDFSRNAYERILDLDRLAPNLNGTYVGGIGSSGGASERLFAFFGGSSQGQHYLLVVFDRANTANRRLLNTRDSTLDGRSVNLGVTGFRIHAAAIDRSGRYLMIYPVDARPVQSVLWDTQTDVFTPLDANAHLNGGHDAYGYGVRVNNASGGAGDAYDAAQWQLRRLSAPQSPTALISPLNAPKHVHLADHPSWHHAHRDVAVPFVSATYRSPLETAPWRAWDDEIIAVEPSTPARVWRFAHHRSDVAHDTDATRTYFWYSPRPNVSPDGRWVLFTSNWEKQLGTDPRGEAGGRFRQDVFLLKLRAAGGSVPGPNAAGELRILTSTLPNGRRGERYSAQLHAAGGQGSITWRLASGAFPPGVRLDGGSGVISGSCVWSGTWTFDITASEGASTDRRTFSLTIQK